MAASVLVGLTGSAAAAPPPAVTRAAVSAGAINHVLVIDLENGRLRHHLRAVVPGDLPERDLLKQGQLVQNYYGIGHASLDNYIAQVSGQAPTEETSADCLTSPVNNPTLNGSYTDVLPGTPDPDQTTYPGQVDGQGCIPRRCVDDHRSARRVQPSRPDHPRRRLAPVRGGYGQPADRVRARQSRPSRRSGLRPPSCQRSRQHQLHRPCRGRLNLPRLCCHS